MSLGRFQSVRRRCARSFSQGILPSAEETPRSLGRTPQTAAFWEPGTVRERARRPGLRGRDLERTHFLAETMSGPASVKSQLNVLTEYSFFMPLFCPEAILAGVSGPHEIMFLVGCRSL